MNDGFFRRVYETVKCVPCGKVATYGQIAGLCGNPRMSRQVGWALHANPEPGVVPCHRIVDREGRLSKAFAFGGINEQAVLLEKEGVSVCADKVDLDVYRWEV